jgi:hypothetical protein
MSSKGSIVVIKIAFMISRYIQQNLTIEAFSVVILTILNYDTYDLILYGIWALISMVWCYYACIEIYWPLRYFFIVCYYLKLRPTSL